MDRETLEALEAALDVTPGNTKLRKQTAKGFFNLGEYQKAKEHLKILIQESRDFEARLLLADCYGKLEEFSTAIVICEDLLDQSNDAELLTLYINLLLKDGQQTQAVEQFKRLKQENPEWRNAALEGQLLVKELTGSEYEDEDEYLFMEKPNMSFEDVGGMEDIKDDIRIKIIHPLNNPDLYKAYGKKAGGGILLYGPPGCGKTYLAKATAGEIKSKFISLGLEEVLDMYVGNSERNLHHKFEVARSNNPCVLFFDEIDAMGSKRNDLKQSAGRNLINQFLKELDGVDTNNEGVLILGATNSPWHMDSAFLRPGRFDRIIFVPPPDEEAREKIIQIQLLEKPIEKIDYRKIASKTDGFSGADIQAMVNLTVEDKLRISMKSGKLDLITTNDLLSSAKKVRPSTKEWFNTARNYALYSNASGMYDDILKYLKL
ncbi:MAG: AAA family ATPase [Flavobacteriales bacterium]|nr:AAA family ATPase [Flavobacteriales bacterium]